MFKRAPRPNVSLPNRDSLASASRRVRGCCPACHLSTRSLSTHSTAPTEAQKRADRLARTEYYSSGAAEQGSARALVSFEKYKEIRDAERPPDIPLDGLIPTTIPSLLRVYQHMTSNAQSPSKAAYYSLMEAAAEYSRTRNGEDVPALRERFAAEVSEEGLRAGLAGVPRAEGEGVQGHQRTGLGWKIAWSAWQDARAGGIDLGVRGFELLLQAARPHPHLVPSLLYHAQNNPAIYQSITGTTYDFLLRAAFDRHRFESVLTLLTEMRMRGITPHSGRMTRAIEMCCENQATRIALELAEGYERVAQKPVEETVWAEILRASAEGHFMQGIETAWDRLVENGDFKPDEGLCLLILNASARHGNPGLATAVLARFQVLGIEPREYHYAPVLEAFCSTGSLPEALQILDTMRTHGGVEPTLATARPLVESMVSRREIRWVDAGFDALEALHTKGQTIDPAAFNAVLKAAEEYGDLKRAVVIYRQAESFGVKPDVETFNTMLAACVKAGAKEQAQTVLQDMETQLGATTKDADTFQHLIELYLTQEDYEPAFHYLEEMKAARHRPPLSVYEGMVRKCWERSDERFRLVLEEMQLGGYKPSRSLIVHLRGETAEAARLRADKWKKGADAASTRNRSDRGARASRAA